MNTILVVVDDPYLRELVIEILETMNPAAQLLEAENGQQGVDLALDHHPDLIILDGEMPVMNGVQAAQLLRRLPSTSSIPLVGMTGAHPDSGLVKNLKSLCNCFIAKPFSLDRFLNTVRQCTPGYAPSTNGTLSFSVN